MLKLLFQFDFGWYTVMEVVSVRSIMFLLFRVCNVLRTWVSKQCDDFLDKELAERLEKFIVIISRYAFLFVLPNTLYVVVLDLHGLVGCCWI